MAEHEAGVTAVWLQGLATHFAARVWQQPRIQWRVLAPPTVATVLVRYAVTTVPALGARPLHGGRYLETRVIIQFYKNKNFYRNILSIGNRLVTQEKQPLHHLGVEIGTSLKGK